jgi:hypothetical protein
MPAEEDSRPLSAVMPYAWGAVSVPTTGEYTLPSLGRTARAWPMAPEANTVSGTAASGTTVPVTGR